jgi:hypothetical protein
MPNSNRGKILHIGLNNFNSKKTILSVRDECDSNKNSFYNTDDFHSISKNTNTSDSTSRYIETDFIINKFHDSTKTKIKNVNT